MSFKRLNESSIKTGLKFNTANQTRLAPARVSATTGSPITASITVDGIVYDYFIFTGTGSISFNRPGLCDVFLVSPGGGGGEGGTSADHFGGGGGAGGAELIENYYVTSPTVTVTIPAGGTGATSGSAMGSQPDAIVFENIRVIAGAPGACSNHISQGGGMGGAGRDGYCGSGAGSNNIGGGVGNGTSSRGIFGGNGGAATAGATGGAGGGAGGAGGNGTDGGAGTSAFSSFMTTFQSLMHADWQTATSSGTVICGGGGGPVFNANKNGGTGGGGASRFLGNNALPGEANTGGGGGGAETGNGGAGGSGLIVVRVRTI